MAAPPAHSKTWQYDLNNGSAGQTAAATALEVKNGLKGFAQNPWTVVRSSNGVTVANSDLWSAAGDIVRGANDAVSRSWIVLQHTTGFQLLWDYVGSSSEVAHFYISPAGLFTGGAINSRPTATDEFYGSGAADSQIAWRAAEAGSDVDAVNVVHSSDGLMTYVSMLGNFGSVGLRGLWVIGVPANLSALWTPRPMVFYINATSEFPSALYAASGGPIMVGHLSPSGGQFTAYGTTEFSDGRELSNQHGFANDISGDQYMAPIGVFCQHEAMFGKVGTLPDLYESRPAASGDTYASKTFVCVGAFLHPWDGVSAVTT
jgi:hypothetical protein